MKVSPPSIIASMINLALKMGSLGNEENIYPLNGPPYNDFVHIVADPTANPPVLDNLPLGRKDL